MTVTTVVRRATPVVLNAQRIYVVHAIVDTQAKAFSQYDLRTKKVLLNLNHSLETICMLAKTALKAL